MGLIASFFFAISIYPTLGRNTSLFFLIKKKRYQKRDGLFGRSSPPASQPANHIGPPQRAGATESRKQKAIRIFSIQDRSHPMPSHASARLGFRDLCPGSLDARQVVTIVEEKEDVCERVEIDEGLGDYYLCFLFLYLFDLIWLGFCVD